MGKALAWDLTLDDGSALHVRKRTGQEITTFDKATGKLLRTLYVYKAVHTLSTGEVQQCFVSDATIEALRNASTEAEREQATGGE